jgi:pimeloyl-ACP methyl ester carboxylesterase
MSHTVQLRKPEAPRAKSQDAMPPPASLDRMPGVPHTYSWHGEKIHYRRLGEGPALVLVHTADVGSSCLEWRKNVEVLAERFTTFAIDLPGFGMSDVRPITYTADLYIGFLIDFISSVAGSGARTVGSGLGASYLVHAEVRRPGLIGRMVLIAPAGLSAFRPNPLRPLAFQALRLPGISALCGASASRTTILEHLKQDVYADDMMAGMNEVEERFWISHRPNAQHVERSRVAGLLNVDVRSVVPKLRTEVLLIWGRQTEKPPLADGELFRELRPETRLIVFDKSGCCPHEEEPNRFNQVAVDFLGADLLAASATMH